LEVRRLGTRPGTRDQQVPAELEVQCRQVRICHSLTRIREADIGWEIGGWPKIEANAIEQGLVVFDML
jgi:hypothetical protein